MQIYGILVLNERCLTYSNATLFVLRVACWNFVVSSLHAMNIASLVRFKRKLQVCFYKTKFKVPEFELFVALRTLSVVELFVFYSHCDRLFTCVIWAENW